MTKLTRNIIIAGSSTVAAGGIAAGVTVAVVKKRDADHKQAMIDKTAAIAASIYNEAHDHELEVMINAQNAQWEEESQRNQEIAQLELSRYAFERNQIQDAQYEIRKTSFEHFREDVVKDFWAEKVSQDILDAKNHSDDMVLLERQRVKFEVAKYAKAEYEGCQNIAWRNAHKDLIVNFADSYPMTVLARDWFHLLQADSVEQIKFLEKDMIFQIQKQYGVKISHLED